MKYLTKKLDLLPHERVTLKMLLMCTVFTGILQAVWIVFPEILRNTLQAEKIFIVVVTLMWPMGQLFAAYWGAYLDGKPDKRKTLIFSGLFGRLPLVFGAFFSTVEPLIFFLMFAVITNPAILASQHGYVQSNFRKEIRGKIYSYIASGTTLSCLLHALLFGVLMDYNSQNYRLIIVFAGLAGFIEAILMSRIKPNTYLMAVYKKIQGQKLSLNEKLFKPWKDLIQLFRADREFFRFEMNFMVYGLGFMIMQPFITLFLVNDLQLTYTQIGLSKGTILQTSMILLFPLVGRLFDKKNPVFFGSFVFLAISVFPAMMMITGSLSLEHPEYMVYLSYFLLSFGWSGLTLVWNLGSMFFANKYDVSRYTGTHVVMVGVRGTIAFFIGILFIERISTFSAFAFTFGCWILTSLLMMRHWMKKYRNVEVTEEIAESASE